MTRAELNAILADLDSDRPHPCGPDLPGRSPAMFALADDLRMAAERLAAAGGSPAGFLFRTPDGGDPEADALIRRIGIDAGRVARLRPGAPIYNSQLLFGSGIRSGLFEHPDSNPRAVVGLEHLTEDQRRRLVRHIRVWWGTGEAQVATPLVLVTAGPQACPELDGCDLATVRLPPLGERRADLPHILLASARRFGLELVTSFRLDAISLLLADPWPGGLAEIQRVFSRLAEPYANDSRLVDPERLRTARLVELYTPPDVEQAWVEVDGLCAECDRVTIRLIGVPFFRAPAAASQPMADSYPPLRLTRLVSWGYSKIKEEGWPNLRIVRNLPPETDVLRPIEQVLDTLRTLQQHWLDPEKGETAGHIERGCEWFRQACGRDNPDEWDVELCVGRLLGSLRDGLLSLRDRLVQIETDPGRDILVAQWKERRQVEWPEQRMKALLQQVLHDMNRHDNHNGLFNRLKEDMRKEVARYLGSPNQEGAVRAWLEEQLLTVFRPPFPMNGKDLIGLGVARERVEECLRYLKDAYQRDPRLTREALLALAVEWNRPPSDS